MTGLMLYNNACKALAAAKATDEVKQIRDKAEAMRAYANQAKNREMEIDAAEIRIRAERRLGEMIREQKEGVGLNTGAMGIGKSAVPKENRTPTLADAGIDKKLSSHAQKVAAIPEAEFEGIVGEWRDSLETANERVTTNILRAAEKAHNHRAQGSSENEWYTPIEYINMARAVMGSIDLDPASSEIANNAVMAATFFTKDDDGAAKNWHGNVFLNPPYSQPEIYHFAQAVVREYKSGRVNQCIVLTHNYTDTRWFHALASSCSAICFTRGRIAFLSPEGIKACPTQGQAFFYFGKNVESFYENFHDAGFIVEVKP